jgi:hypothetical protein
MRNRRHDYRRTAAGWSGEHGETIWVPRDHGQLLVKVNDFAPARSELYLAVGGFIEAERVRWERWSMGDIPLPRSFSEYIEELPTTPVPVMFAHARDMDADDDVYDAIKNSRA